MQSQWESGAFTQDELPFNLRPDAYLSDWPVSLGAYSTMKLFSALSAFLQRIF